MKPTRILALLATASLLAGCGGDDGGPNPGPDTEDFAAILSWEKIIAYEVVSTATGSAAFEWDEEVLSYSIDVQSMDNVTAGHIHGPATADQDAAIILTLFAPDNPSGAVNGRLVSGTVTAGSGLITPGWTLDQILDLMRAGNAYVMVHSTEYPDGEIRGQVDAE